MTGAPRVVLGLLALAAALGAPDAARPADFASLRRTADEAAGGARPGYQLLMVYLTASHANGVLTIDHGEFHYAGPLEPLAYRVPGVTTRRGELPMLRVRVRLADGASRPAVEQFPYRLEIDDAAWPMTAVPSNVVSPETAVRRLNRQIPGDPYRSPRAGPPGGDRTRKDLFDLKLVRIGDERAAASRTGFQWAGLSAAFGFRKPQAEFFQRTGPLGRWIWWTVVEQRRVDPAADPRRAGTPRRVFEYIYIDAITGKVESHCHGADQRSIPC